MPKTKTLLEVAGEAEDKLVKNIVFDGLKLCSSDAYNEVSYTSVNGIIEISNARYITVKNSEITNSGTSAIMLKGNSQQHTIINNYIHDIGIGGVEAYSGAKTIALRNGYHEISNNLIKGIGQVVGFGNAIYIEDSGFNHVAYNTITDVTKVGIHMKSYDTEELLKKDGNGNWIPYVLEGKTLSTPEDVLNIKQSKGNVIEFNDMSNCTTDAQDYGPYDSWCTGKDNIVYNNIIRDSGVNFSFGFGLYLDNWSDYTTVKNNLVYGMQRNPDQKGRLLDTISFRGSNSGFRSKWHSSIKGNRKNKIRNCS